MITSLIKIKLPTQSSAAKCEEFLEISNQDVLFDIETDEGEFIGVDADSGGISGINLSFSLENDREPSRLQVSYWQGDVYALRETRRGSRWQKEVLNTSTIYTLEVEGSVSPSDIRFYVDRSGLEGIFSPDWITVERLGGDRYLNSAGLMRYDDNIKMHIATMMARKQDRLQSGVNIKSINNQSLLGSGNLEISSGKTYTNGNGIVVDNVNNTISVDNTVAKIDDMIIYVSDMFSSKNLALSDNTGDTVLDMTFRNDNITFNYHEYPITLYATEKISDADWSALWQ